MAIWVMKHPATGGHALGTRSAAATASTHPHPVRPTSRHTAMEGPRPAPLPSVGAPAASPPSQLPRSLSRTEPGPSPAAPQAPSHLPYHSIPPPRLHSRVPVSRAAPHAGSGESGPRPCCRRSPPRRSANAGDGAGWDQAPLAAPRPLAPSLAWRRTGKLA